MITGASSGIGEELAACFAEGGFDLVLVARNADKLQALAARLSAEHGVQAWVAAADLSRRGSAEKLAREMKRRKRPIDVLVNCAGVLAHGEFIDIHACRHQELIDLNVSGLTAMHRACIDGEVIKVPGTLNLAGTLLSRATPKWLVRWVGGALGRATTRS